MKTVLGGGGCLYSQTPYLSTYAWKAVGAPIDAKGAFNYASEAPNDAGDAEAKMTLDVQ